LFTNLIWSQFTQMFANTLWLILKSIILISNKIAGLSWQIVEVGRPALILIFSFYLGVLMFIFWQHQKFRKIALFMILIMVNIFVGQKIFQPKSLKITFLDVKQGDAIFLYLPNRRTMLIDAGIKDGIVSQFLKSQGIKKIDLAVITHPHFDHYGGFIDLLDNFKIQNFLLATDKSNDTIYTNLVAKIKSKKINTIFAQANEIINGLDVSAEILTPNEEIKKFYELNKLDANDISIVLKISVNNTKLLFTGDIDDIETIKNSAIRADILKSPHHGSEKVNYQLLFDLVQPRYLIITGRKNISQELSDLAIAKQIKIYSIRKAGALTITLNHQHSF
ncbi:MAG: MBL fold metallo-hydrolase, partial [candidate division WOR-3 bacterium]|nr:MBL fold metallo-hydrolase [candidate division WOR-3 bacterium]